MVCIAKKKERRNAKEKKKTFREWKRRCRYHPLRICACTVGESLLVSVSPFGKSGRVGGLGFIPVFFSGGGAFFKRMDHIVQKKVCVCVQFGKKFIYSLTRKTSPFGKLSHYKRYLVQQWFWEFWKKWGKGNVNLRINEFLSEDSISIF